MNIQLHDFCHKVRWRLSSTNCALLEGWDCSRQFQLEPKAQTKKIDQTARYKVRQPVTTRKKSSNKIPLNRASSCVDLWDLNDAGVFLRNNDGSFQRFYPNWTKSLSFTSPSASLKKWWVIYLHVSFLSHPWWRDLYEFHFLCWVGGDPKSAWLNELSGNSTFPFRCLRTEGKCHFGFTIASELQKAIALRQKTWSQIPDSPTY